MRLIIECDEFNIVVTILKHREKLEIESNTTTYSSTYSKKKKHEMTLDSSSRKPLLFQKNKKITIYMFK